MDALEVPEGLRALAGVPEQGRGVVDGGHPDAPLFYPLTMFPGDAEVGADEAQGGNPAQADNDFRANQCHLVPQVVDAGVLLNLHGVPVFGWAALDNVGDVAIVPPQVDDTQHVVQKLTSRADEGLSLQVLLLAGPLAHKHDVGVSGAYAKDHIVPGFTQATPGTCPAGCF